MIRVRYPKVMHSYFMVGIHVLASGVTSFLVLAVGNRNLDSVDFRIFTLNWNFINFSLLVLMSPIEALAPKLLNELPNVQTNMTSLKNWARKSTLFIALIVIIINFFETTDSLLVNISTLLLYIVVVAKTYLARSILVAAGEFKSIARMSIISAALSVMLFLVFELSNLVTISSIYLCVATGLGAGLISLYFSDAKFNPKRVLPTNKPEKSIDREVIVRLAQMSFTAFIQLGLVMTGVIALAFLGATKNDLFTYSALSGLALICLSFVNSASVPMSKQISSISVLTDVEKYRGIFLRNIAIYLTGLIATIVLSITIKSVYLEVLSGSTLEVSIVRTILIVVAMGVQFMIVVPKIVLIGLGRETQILYIWSCGFIIYISSMFLPLDPYLRVCIAIFSSGIFILSTASVFVLYNISRLQIERR